jgi:RecA/RadA recombinase
LDRLLGGGVPFSRLTELSGDSGSGKSQLMFTVAANFPFGRGKVLYVDTEGTFRPERLHQIATLRGKDPDSVLKGVDVLGARAIEKVVAGVAGALVGGTYACVLVDSLSDLFYGGGELARDTARLSLFCRDLAWDALMKGIMVVVANGMSYNPTTGITSAQGSQYTAPYIHTRISLSRNGDRWMALDLESGSRVEFLIGPAGTGDL